MLEGPEKGDTHKYTYNAVKKLEAATSTPAATGVPAATSAPTATGVPQATDPPAATCASAQQGSGATADVAVEASPPEDGLATHPVLTDVADMWSEF